MPMIACLVAGILTGAAGRLAAANPLPPLLNDPVDVSGDFRDFSDLYYLADRLAAFDPATGTGKITWQRAQYITRQAFDNMLAVVKPVAPNEFPENEYAANPTLPFSIEFVPPRTVRIRVTSGPPYRKNSEELMLVRNGTVLPQINPAQSILQLDWSKLDLVVFAKNSPTAEGLVCLPSDNLLHELVLNKDGSAFKLANDPFGGKAPGTFAWRRMSSDRKE